MARRGANRNSYTVLVGKPERRKAPWKDPGVLGLNGYLKKDKQYT